MNCDFKSPPLIPPQGGKLKNKLQVNKVFRITGSILSKKDFFCILENTK
jgi:hypothetical protein